MKLKKGAGSVKGLVLMETIFPSGDGSTVFDDPKMRQKLMAEIKKGKIKPPTQQDEVDVDEDQDSKIDQMVSTFFSERLCTRAPLRFIPFTADQYAYY
jgi:hypothetical protein